MKTPFSNLIPPLSREEYSQLESNILADGCREALITWDGKLIDGHNRLRICTDHGLPYDTAERQFASEDQAKLWIITNQLGRRNLTPFARAELALQQGEIFSKQAHENKKLGAGKKLVQNSAQGKTRDKLARLADVSHDTIAKVKKIIEKAPELREELRSGELSINQAYQQLSKPHQTQGTGDPEHYTPAEYIDAVRQVLGTIDLDPASCAVANEIVKAKRYYTKDDDGLSKSWKGKVFCNPPYNSGLVDKFVEKLVKHFKESDITEAILLVNNCTETQWFNLCWLNASAVCFPKGRIKFISRHTGSSGLQGQAILYFGSNTKQFFEAFKQFAGGLCTVMNVE